MPASILDPVNAALRNALTNNDSENALNGQLIGAARRGLLADTEFEPAVNYQASVLEKLKSKYLVIKGSETPQPSKPEGDVGAEGTLKLPSFELFPSEAVQLGWNNCDWSVGAGMINMGNTCYLNSTLQALFHVPALVNWLMSDKEHMAECQEPGGLCIICAMRKTLQDSQKRNNTTIRPLLIYNKLRVFGRNLIPGRQEDAHEFLRYLVEAMEKSYLNRFKNHSEFDSKVKETTPLNQILGGYLRSAVRCLKCGHVSTTFQHFQDLLLDIRKAQTLDEALEGYFSREKLDDDSYHCQSCQKKVPATKQFSLERAPMVLCIQLKRFSVSNHKITKHIHFRQRLDVTRYARHRPSVPLIYRLVALVTHMGPTVNCGHYTSVAQAPTGNFYQFDDSMVRVITHQAVFNTNAYIMLYELESSPFAQKLNNAVITNKLKSPITSEPNNIIIAPPKVTTTNGIGYTSAKVYGPELPPAHLQKKLVNGHGPSTSHLSGGDSDSSDNSDLENVENDTSQKEVKQEAATISSKTDTSSNSNEPKLSNNKIQFNSKPQTKILGTSCSNITNGSSPIKTEFSMKTEKYVQSNVTKLVPYEPHDSSSEESIQSVSELESRVSTKAAVGDWKVTTSLAAEVTSENSQAKTWEKNKPQDNTISKLFKMSHNGYSAPVSSWNGTRSQLDKEIASERREDRKRSLLDNSDQGKIKHQKMNNVNHKSNPGYNPMQEYHNGKNWNHNRPGHYKTFYHPGNRHRKNFHHHKGFQKNYRFRQ